MGGPPPSHDGAACQTDPMLIIDPLELIVGFWSSMDLVSTFNTQGKVGKVSGSDREREREREKEGKREIWGRWVMMVMVD